MFSWLKLLLSRKGDTPLPEAVNNIKEPTYKLVEDIQSGAWEYKLNEIDPTTKKSLPNSHYQLGWILSKGEYIIYLNVFNQWVQRSMLSGELIRDLKCEKILDIQRNCRSTQLFNKDEEAFLIQNIMKYIHVKELEKKKAYKAEMDIMRERETRNRATAAELERNRLTEFLRG